MNNTSRIFNKVLTLKFSILNIANLKNYLSYDVSEISNNIIKGISVSYYFTAPGQVNQGYLTIVNKSFETMVFNYPLTDLQDSTNPTIGTVLDYKLRLFNLKDISLRDSYIIVNDCFIPSNRLDINLNFYY